MKPKVLVDCQQYGREEDWERLRGHAELIEPQIENPYSEGELIEALQGIQGVIRLGGRIPELNQAVFSGASDLQIVGVRGDRFGRGIDLVAAEEFGVKVVDTDNIASAPPVAEWVLALILVCLRNGGAVYRQMMAGTEQWANAQNDDFVNGELTERRVGLIGCGHVGQRLIELLEPFRVDLKVSDPYLEEEVVERLGIGRGNLEEVLEHAEILVVQVPHTPKTEKMIGGRELEMLGKGSILINCCRGPVIDQEVLIDRLEAGELIAGLDVFDPEPLPGDNRLRELPNAFISPHIAWYAPNVFHRYFSCMALEFERFFTGQLLQSELTQRMVDIRNGRL
jgi:D-3-phosphoglycerate dehydrogenase / 2-oxoglutarate reductase